MSQGDIDERASEIGGTGWIAPRWQSRMYGRCRARGRNRLAWFFADKHGRKILRDLRAIKRVQR